MDEIERLLAEAYQLMRAERNLEAAELLRLTAEARPGDARVLVAWAEALIGLRWLEQARWKLDRAIEVDDTYAPAYLRSGQLLLRLGLPVLAVERFKQVALVLEPAAAAAYAGWGEAREDLGDDPGAARMLEEAVARADTSASRAEHLLRLGEVLQRLKRLKPALEAYRMVVEMEADGLSREHRFRALRASAGAAPASMAGQRIRGCRSSGASPICIIYFSLF